MDRRPPCRRGQRLLGGEKFRRGKLLVRIGLDRILGDLPVLLPSLELGGGPLAGGGAGLRMGVAPGQQRKQILLLGRLQGTGGVQKFVISSSFESGGPGG